MDDLHKVLVSSKAAGTHPPPGQSWLLNFQLSEFVITQPFSVSRPGRNGSHRRAGLCRARQHELPLLLRPLCLIRPWGYRTLNPKAPGTYVHVVLSRGCLSSTEPWNRDWPQSPAWGRACTSGTGATLKFTWDLKAKLLDPECKGLEWASPLPRDFTVVSLSEPSPCGPPEGVCGTWWGPHSACCGVV